MKRMQGFICGFLAAVVLMMAFPALAASIDVVFNPLNIVINGKQVANKNENYTLANGNKVPFSIVYEGTTYLPLRKMAEILGKDIVLDSTTDTVHLNDPVITYNPKEEFPVKEGQIVSEQKYVTRAELMRFFVQSLDLKDTGTACEFFDVPTTHEYYEDIKIAAQHLIINYVEPTNIGPNDSIFKWQYALYLCRALKITPSEYKDFDIAIKDISQAPLFSRESIKVAVSLGLMQLDENGNFSPNEYLVSPLTPNPALKNYIQSE